MLIHSILVNLLNSYSKDYLQISLIDSKILELITYKEAKQVKDFANNIYDIKRILQNINKEIDERYDLLSKNNYKNIVDYNKNKKDKLPYRLLIIDELSGVIVQDYKINELITKIARNGRGCGVHMIISTLSASKQIIPGLLGANLPSRIALSVLTKRDSQNILDESGAEKLAGNGDMLVKLLGNNELKRVQGIFISEEEIESIVRINRKSIETITIQNQKEEKEITKILKKQLIEKNLLDIAIKYGYDENKIYSQTEIDILNNKIQKKLKRIKKRNIAMHILQVMGICVWNILKWTIGIIFMIIYIVLSDANKHTKK